ncbi:hypothetical protein [Nonomuraea lactucae]|uniref:hypothetical protein n=1 Tax=Nonomuraea lactucae TaxID=2249762 RepID=UPI000DE2A681|nr:hypothetical protein [Nonomuraea lactucae]
MLATLADVTARLGRELEPEETARIEALISDVSALVEAHTRRTFGRVENDVITLESPSELTLELPGKPVHQVMRVEIDGHEVTDWSLVQSALWRRWGWRLRWLDMKPSTVKVTYTHGGDAVPADVKAVVCQEVIRLLSGTPGVQAESVGDVSITYADSGGSVGLSAAAKRSLNKYRRKAGSVATKAA